MNTLTSSGRNMIMSVFVIAVITIVVAFAFNRPTPPKPTPRVDINIFNVGPCQYMSLLRLDALAVVHLGNCTNSVHTNLICW